MLQPTLPAADPGLPTARQYDDHDPRYAYLEWLHCEARLLRLELYGRWQEEYTPCNTFAASYHFPGSDASVLPPSTRALKMLEAAGVRCPHGTKPTMAEPLSKERASR